MNYYINVLHLCKAVCITSAYMNNTWEKLHSTGCVGDSCKSGHNIYAANSSTRCQHRSFTLTVAGHPILSEEAVVYQCGKRSGGAAVQSVSRGMHAHTCA